MAAGAMYGTVKATLLVSFASSIGATLAFLAARFFLKDAVERRFGERLAPIRRGVERDGVYYLFLLRMVPVLPFVVVNAAMGLTRMRTWTYYWVSQAGMLAGTFLFATAGASLASAASPWDALSPQLLACFAAIGVLPLLAKKLYELRSPTDGS